MQGRCRRFPDGEMSAQLFNENWTPVFDVAGGNKLANPCKEICVDPLKTELPATRSGIGLAQLENTLRRCSIMIRIFFVGSIICFALAGFFVLKNQARLEPSVNSGQAATNETPVNEVTVLWEGTHQTLQEVLPKLKETKAEEIELPRFSAESTLSEIENSVRIWEGVVASEDMISRLNSGRTTSQEKKYFGKVLERLGELRHQIIKLKLAKLNEAIKYLDAKINN